MEERFLHPCHTPHGISFSQQLANIIHQAQQRQFSTPFTLTANGWYANKVHQSDVKINSSYCWIDKDILSCLYLLSAPEIKGFYVVVQPAQFFCFPYSSNQLSNN